MAGVAFFKPSRNGILHFQEDRAHLSLHCFALFLCYHVLVTLGWVDRSTSYVGVQRIICNGTWKTPQDQSEKYDVIVRGIPQISVIVLLLSHFYIVLNLRMKPKCGVIEALVPDQLLLNFGRWRGWWSDFRTWFSGKKAKQFRTFQPHNTGV